MRFYILIVIALLTLSFDGCSRDSTNNEEQAGREISSPSTEDKTADKEITARPDSAATSGDSTANKEMADRLQRAYDRFPKRSYLHCNSERASAIEQMMVAPNNPQDGRLKFAHAVELMNAGKTEQALEELQQVVAEIEKLGGGLNTATKPVYDILAIAHLRLGEEQNCCANHNDESCIFPLAGKAIHTKRSGSESAVKVYEQILGKFPDDIQSQYLLNVAYMTLGEYPENVPADLLLPDLDRASEVDFPPFKEIAINTGSDVIGLSGGVCLEDMNNDGRLDIVCSSYGLNDPIKYLENDGENGFVDRTVESGLAGVVSGLNMVHGDYDNDGDNDVFLLRGAWLGEYGGHPNSLLRNNGNGTFEDATISAGVYSEHPSQNACWADFNNDGFLDLFIGNEHNSATKHPCELYLNQRNGTFEEVAGLSGVQSMVYAKGCAAADYDNDGLQDLYVSNLNGDNLLYRNVGIGRDGIPFFKNVATKAGVQDPYHSFPCWFFDFDNDGFQDLFVADYDPEGFTTLAGEVAKEMMGKISLLEKPRLYRNKGDGTFEDVTIKAGLWRSTFAMGCNYGDLNNDGYLDFYIGNGAPDLRMIVPNLMFLNDEGNGFIDVTTNGRFGNLQKGHAVAFADIDNDGDQDIYEVMGGAVEGDTYQNVLFQNPGWENNWVKLEIVGTESNRSAIGAIVEVRIADESGSERTVYRRVGTGGSFGSSCLCQEIGLGDCLEINSVRVNWPNGQMAWESFEGIEKDKAYRLLEGSGTASAMSRPKISF